MTETTQIEHEDLRDIYSVSEINHHLKQLIGANFALIWVEGEISNLARPASGHIYFSLKDENAQIRCVMFRSSQKKVSFDIDNGMQVIVRAKASLYEPRGDLQLVADEMEEAGLGNLQRQYEALKKKLFSEGLFATELKKEIPVFPNEVAIITSPTGAAIKDYLNVAQRRYPTVKKTLYCVSVQGELAANSISSAVMAANRQAHADIIILIRGGGSIEDLWAFNDEQLARTIAASTIPVVTGIGHEIDYTIADFVADLRAPTPSIAAELTMPDIQTILSHVASMKRDLVKHGKEALDTRNQNLDWLFQRLQRIHPSKIMNTQKRQLGGLLQRLRTTSSTHIQQRKNQFEILLNRLQSNSPTNLVKQASAQSDFYCHRLLSSVSQQVARKRHQLQLSMTTMHAISPLGTLDRGYSITVKHGPPTKIISKYDQIQPGDQLVTYLATGQVMSRVESTSSENSLTNFRSIPRKRN